MNIKDAIYWIGLFLGLIIGAQVMKLLGIGGILRFLGALVVGVGLGWLAERVYASGKNSK